MRRKSRLGLSPAEFDQAMIDRMVGRIAFLEGGRKSLPRALLKSAPSYLPDSPYSESELHEARIKEAARQLAGLSILAKHYQITKHYGLRSRTDGLYWRAVALELACDCVPYLKPRSKQTPGPAKFWTRKELLRLWYEIQRQRNLNLRRLDDACIVAGKQLYPSASNARHSKYNLDTLRARYKDACKLIKRRPDIPGLAEFERDMAVLPPVEAPPVQD
jgi:hypothetical protein